MQEQVYTKSAEESTDNSDLDGVTYAKPYAARPKPVCIYCGTLRESYTGDPCPCPGAVEAIEDRAAMSADRSVWTPPSTPVRTTPAPNPALERMRKEAAKDQADAAKEASLADRETKLRERNIAAQERRQDAIEAARAEADLEDQPDFASFCQEVSLLGVDRLPSAFTRVDGETLFYQGRFNTLYGEGGIGKTWVALMAVIQHLRAGGTAIWWDAEDRASTVAQRLQLLKATDLIGTPDLKWVSGDFHTSAKAVAGALEHLDGSDIPGMIVIDSATSFGCPSDGADVMAWLQEHINPWWDAGHTVLLIDHVPKQRKDRPRGGIGSQAKLARIDGAALYAQGIPWNGHESGYVHLTVHKDRQGQLPATLNGVAATVSAEWDGLSLAWEIGLPDAKADGENLEDELLEAIFQAGDTGVRGAAGLRALLKGKSVKDIDKARDELLQAGMIERVKDGRAWVWKAIQ